MGGARKGKKAAAKAPTTSQVYTEIAASTGLTKAQVASVFAALEDVMTRSVKIHGSFNLGGLIKVYKHRKKAQPAKPAREGRNPRTGEVMMLKPKPMQPAKDIIKVKPLKKLKDKI